VHRQTARAEAVASNFDGDVVGWSSSLQPSGCAGSLEVRAIEYIHSCLASYHASFSSCESCFCTLLFNHPCTLFTLSAWRQQQIHTSDKMAYAADSKQVYLQYPMLLLTDSMLTSLSGDRRTDQPIQRTRACSRDWPWRTLWQHLCWHVRNQNWIYFVSCSLFKQPIPQELTKQGRCF
jgi:hypothetical protein